MSFSRLLFYPGGTLVDTRADLVASASLMPGDFGRAPLPCDLSAGVVGEGATRLGERAEAGREGFGTRRPGRGP